jgi:hypothetical protein
MKNDLEQNIRHIFGLDFGTSNTHMSISTAAEAVPIVDDVKIESNASVPSVILYDERNFEVLGFGQPALEEWHSMSRSQRRQYTLGTGFKQRLSFNKRAETETELFLNALLTNLDKQKIFDIKNFINNTEMVCGVPSKTHETHSEKMIAILSKLIGKTPVLIEEPLGALYYHIVRKDITKEDGRGGVLVIDFGGGTLDLAYIKNFKIQKVWGSPVIGGVLFDDLFYNLFLQQNKGVKSLVEKEGLSGYLRTVLFKNLKEKYSVLHATSEHTQMNENIVFGQHSYGTLSIPNFDYLYEQMSTYKMSDELKHDLKGSDYSKRLEVEEFIDLPNIITSEVLRGQKEFGIRPDSISLIILTGGSSRWKFFVDMIERKFPYTRILASSDPESTISRGLGLSYSAKLYEKRVRTELRAHEDELEERLKESYQKLFKDALSQYTQTVFSIFSLEIENAITNFLNEGGTIVELDNRLKHNFLARQPELKSLNDGFLKEINYQIEKSTKEELSRWFNRSLVKYELLNQNNLANDQLTQSGGEINPLNDLFFNMITAISSVIVGLISGAIVGGGGIALLASGPLGWLSGFIGGVVLAVASAMGLKKPVAEKMKKIRIPKWVLKILYASRKRLIKKAKTTLEADLKETEKKIYKNFLEVLKENDQKLEKLIDEQIQEISYANIVDVYD